MGGLERGFEMVICNKKKLIIETILKYFLVLLLPVTIIIGCDKSTKADCTGEKKDNPCITNVSKVCGCDGKTYDSGCLATNAGVKNYTTGSCSQGNTQTY